MNVGSAGVRHRRQRNSWSVQVAAVIGVAIAAISIIGAAPSQSSGHGGLTQVSAAYPVVVVQSGDSLWSVAERVSSSEDPRVVVDRLKGLNDLGNQVLQPGQILRVE